MHQSIKDNPIIATSLFVTVGSILGLRPIPSSIPLLVLLVSLRLSTQWIVPRPHAIQYLFYLWAGTAVGCVVSFASAGSTAVRSVSPTLIYSAIFTLIGMIPFVAAAKYRTNGLLFPAIWVTWWSFVSIVSPVGRLGVWAPLAGDGAYSWMRPYFGEQGIDWIVGGWTEVLAYFISWHLMGRPYASEDRVDVHLFDVNEMERGDNTTPQKQGANHNMTFLTTLLILMSMPSAFINPLPTPLYGDNLRQVGIACVLPELNDDVSPFEMFLKETSKLTSRAHVVLWPEGAIYFDSAADRSQKLELVRNNTEIHGSSIGVSFTEPEPHQDGQYPSGKRRNGIALVNRDGIVFEYYKRHLVPLVESFPQVKGSRSSPVVNITEGAKRHPNRQFQFTVSANICLDFAHPSHDLPVKPTLILGPARTWQTDVARVMMEMARHRADELGTRVLWCDGGKEGLSGVVGMGESGVQVGHGSWVKLISVEIPLDEKRTLYGRHSGEFWGLIGSWSFFFVTWVRLPGLSRRYHGLAADLHQRGTNILRRFSRQPILLSD